MQNLLRDSRVGDQRGVVDFFTQGLQNLLPVIVKVALDLVDRLLLDDPKLTFGLSDQSLVMSNDDHATWWCVTKVNLVKKQCDKTPFVFASVLLCLIPP